MKKCAFIYNPHSGNHKIESYLSQLEKIIAQKYEVALFPTKYPKHATEIVKDLKDTDLVISAGGDGTFKEIVSGNMMRKDPIKLSHLPCGTINDFKNTFSMKGNLPQILSSIIDGEDIKLDIFTLNNNIFFYAAALGAFANVPYDTSPKVKKVIGRLAYGIRIIKEMFHKIPVYDIKYEVNNKQFEEKVSIILASNTTSVGGIDKVLKDAVLSDGKFEFILLKYKSRRQIIRDLFTMVSKIKDYKSVKNVICYQTDKVTIEFKDIPSREWCLDGEKDITDKNITIQVIGTVDMLLPRYSVKKILDKVD